jgi:hypothetical protein
MAGDGQSPIRCVVAASPMTAWSWTVPRSTRPHCSERSTPIRCSPPTQAVKDCSATRSGCPCPSPAECGPYRRVPQPRACRRGRAVQPVDRIQRILARARRPARHGNLQGARGTHGAREAARARAGPDGGLVGEHRRGIRLGLLAAAGALSDRRIRQGPGPTAVPQPHSTRAWKWWSSTMETTPTPSSLRPRFPARRPFRPRAG